MAPVALKKKIKRPFGPGDNGILLTPEEFDWADFEEGYRYELINGVVIVSPMASEEEADPNDELNYWLRNYGHNHPKGSALDATLGERTVYAGATRRRADRLIWAGLGRLPRSRETPTIIVEFVSQRKRDQVRDYETKRDEYLGIDVKEYWVIDRFQRTLTVFTRKANKTQQRVLRANQIYRTSLLPGFELPLAQLLAQADRWANQEEPAEEP